MVPRQLQRLMPCIRQSLWQSQSLYPCRIEGSVEKAFEFGVWRNLRRPLSSDIASGASYAHARILDGRRIASEWQDELCHRVKCIKERFGRPPGLGIILVGDRPDSLVYVTRKQEACEHVGIHAEIRRLPSSVPQHKLQEAVRRLSQDSRIDGLIVQLPLPPHVDEEAMIEDFDPSKDVDGFHPINVGRTLMRGRSATFVPCTALACIELLRRSSIQIKDKTVAILGDSNIVGMPLAMLFRDEGASTVTVVHKTSYSCLFDAGNQVEEPRDGKTGKDLSVSYDSLYVRSYLHEHNENASHRAEAGACLPLTPGPRPYEISYASALRDAYASTDPKEEEAISSENLENIGWNIENSFESEQNLSQRILHAHLQELKRITSTADILVVAVGFPRLIKSDWLKSNAVVVDVGINVIGEIHNPSLGKDTANHEQHTSGESLRRLAIEPSSHLHVVGDVDFEDACHVASAVSPVPGGVGPMTIAAVLNNTVQAAAMNFGIPQLIEKGSIVSPEALEKVEETRNESPISD